MTKRKGWAPPRKRPKRLAKKLWKRNMPRKGWRVRYLIPMSREATEEFARQLLAPPEPNEKLREAIRLAISQQ